MSNEEQGRGWSHPCYRVLPRMQHGMGTALNVLALRFDSSCSREPHLVSQMGRAFRYLVLPSGCSDLVCVSALSDKDFACFGPATVRVAIKRVAGQTEHRHLTLELELFVSDSAALFSHSFVRAAEVLEYCWPMLSSHCLYGSSRKALEIVDRFSQAYRLFLPIL